MIIWRATIWQTNLWSQLIKNPQDWKCPQPRFCEQSEDKKREILAVDVEWCHSDLLHNPSCFYTCHIWTRHFPGRELSWNGISSLSWRKASFLRCLVAEQFRDESRHFAWCFAPPANKPWQDGARNFRKIQIVEVFLNLTKSSLTLY